MSTVEDDHVALWLAWKRAVELSRNEIRTTVMASTPVGESDLTVLAHIHGAGGTIRQNALADATGWDRTRLSHLITRMEERGYVSRTRLANGVDVGLLEAGALALSEAKAPLAEAVREKFISRLTQEQLDVLKEIIRAVNGEAAPMNDEFGL